VSDFPEDAADEKEWRALFSRFGAIARVEVVKRSGALIDLMAQRGKLQKQV
jgi:hypothetical protein